MDGCPQVTPCSATYWCIITVHSAYVATINDEVDASHLLAMFHFKPSVAVDTLDILPATRVNILHLPFFICARRNMMNVYA